MAGQADSSQGAQHSAPPSQRKLISVVIPVYRSERSLGPLVERLDAVLGQMDYDAEVVLVDDRSPDESWRVMVDLKERYPGLLKIARLERNGGQHNAICCGFTLCKGDIVVTMDDDLQNPPEEIPKLVAAVESGFDLAIGAYDSKKHSKGRNLGGQLIDGVLRRIFGLRSDFQLTSYRAVKGAVVRRLRHVNTPFPYVTALLFSNAATRTNVPVRHDARPFGQSNYSLRNSVSLALNLLLNYSLIPLQFVGAMVLFSVVLTGVFGLITLVRGLMGEVSIQGWASTIVLICTVGTQMMFSMLILLIYVTRINHQLNVPVMKQAIEEFHD